MPQMLTRVLYSLPVGSTCFTYYLANMLFKKKTINTFMCPPRPSPSLSLPCVIQSSIQLQLALADHRTPTPEPVCGPWQVGFILVHSA